jgi:hypothetical protein
MTVQKLSLATIKGKLSKNEMKKIMAGSGGCIGAGCGSFRPCPSMCVCSNGRCG